MRGACHGSPVVGISMVAVVLFLLSSRPLCAQVVVDSTVMAVHDGVMRDVTFDASGERLLTIARDLRIKLWNVDSEELQWDESSPHREFQVSGRFSADGMRVLTAGEDTITIRDAATGDVIDVIAKDHGDSSEGFMGAIFSPDERFILSFDADSLAVIWNAVTGEPVRELHGHTWAIFTASYSRDGSRILTASADGTARVWNVETGQEISRFAAPPFTMMNGSVFGADDATIYSIGRDTIYQWNAETGARLAAWKGIAGVYDPNRFNAIHQIETFQEGRYIATTSDSGIRLWDAGTRELVALIGQELGGFGLLDITQDGRKLAAVGYNGAFTDVNLWTLDWPSSVDEPTTGGRASLSATISPNPISDAFSITFTTVPAMPVSVTVIDPLGRRAFAGNDVLDRSGRMMVALPPLASGIYFCVIECGTIRCVKTIKIIH